MKISRTHIIVISILSLPLAYLTYLGGMNYSGYCFEKNRYLTFDDKVRVMFNHIDRDNVYLPVGNEWIKFKALPYISFEEYLKENPDCCSLIPIDHPISPAKELGLAPPNFLERITGDHSGEVITVKFRLNYFDRSGQLTFKDREYSRVLTNCGNIRD